MKLAEVLNLKLESLAPEVSWKAIIGFRNIIVHAYHEIDWESVVAVITHDLSIVKQQIADKRLEN